MSGFAVILTVAPYISVKDDGIGMDKDTINNVLDKGLNMNKVGIRNVNDRIQLNFGEEYGLEIQSCKGEGTEVIMKIPAMDGRKGTDEDINR